MWMFKLCNDFIMMCSYWALWSTFPFESTLDLITLRFQFLFRTRFDKEINLSPMSPSFKIDLFQKTFYVKNGSDNLTLKQLYQPIFSCTWILSLKNKTLSFSYLKCNLLVSVSPTQNKRIVCGCHYNTFFDWNLFVKSPNPAFSYSKERMDFFSSLALLLETSALARCKETLPWRTVAQSYSGIYWLQWDST